MTRLPHIPRTIVYTKLGELSPSKYTVLSNGCAYSFLLQRSLNGLGKPSRLMPPRSYRNEIGTIIHKVFELVNSGKLAADRNAIKEFWKGAIIRAEERIMEQYPSLRNLSISDYNAMFTTIKVASSMAPQTMVASASGRSIVRPNEHDVILPGLLKGVIDRIDCASSGTYRIVDYKTGRVFEEDGCIKKDYIDQLNLYAYMLEEAEHVIVSSLAIIDKDGNSIDVPYYPDRKQVVLCEVESLIKSINEAIEENNVDSLFSPEEKNCQFCPVFHLCPRRIPLQDSAFKMLEGRISRIWNDDQLELTLSDNTIVTITKLRVLEIEEWPSLLGKEAIFVNLLEITENKLYNRTDNTVIYIKD